ncbi:unnamed protein product [Somion occarium]|uniref:Uncharacterized protein n=1 Tax=Somion occarium TaxID=3059160 RepID=A0ABP1CX16_9APHY
MATVGLLSGVEADDIDMMTYRAVMFCGLPNYDLKLPPSRMLRSMVVQVNPADEGVIIEIRGWDVVFPHDEFALAIGRPHSLPRPFLHLNLASAFMHNDVEGLMHTTRHFDFQELQTLLFVFNSESRVYNRIGHELADIFDTDSIETLIVPD